MLIVNNDMAINLDNVLSFDLEDRRIYFYYSKTEYDKFEFESEEKARSAYNGIMEAMRRGDKVFDCDKADGV